MAEQLNQKMTTHDRAEVILYQLQMTQITNVQLRESAVSSIESQINCSHEYGDIRKDGKPHLHQVAWWNGDPIADFIE